jgi:hypothetical protein
VNERRKIESALREKEQELQLLEDKTKEARVYVQALQDVLRILPKASESAILRPGSAVAEARSVILKAQRPVHINTLLSELGKDGTREARASLTSSLAAYVRRGEIFARPAPNTYGLIELGHQQTEDAGASEPPSNFGRLNSPPAPSVTPDDDEVPF